MEYCEEVEANAPLIDDQSLRHELGCSLWRLARVVTLSKEPGAWASNVPVPPYGLCINDVASRLRAVQRFKHHDRGSAVPKDEEGERVIAQAQELMRALHQSGPGLSSGWLTKASQLAMMAEQLMDRPSLEHAMSLGLLAHIGMLQDGGDDLIADSVGRLRAIEESTDSHWSHVYRCRRGLFEGQSLSRRFRGAIGSMPHGDRGLAQEALVAIQERFEQSLESCHWLRDRSPMHFSAHLQGIVRFRLWAVYVACEDWSAAMGEWGRLISDCGWFYRSELPCVRDFLVHVGPFAMFGGVSDEVLQQLWTTLDVSDRETRKQEYRPLVQSARRQVEGAARMRDVELNDGGWFDGARVDGGAPPRGALDRFSERLSEGSIGDISL